MRNGLIGIAGGVICLGVLGLAAQAAWAHCDTMDGPVVAAARQALDRGELTPALKWVKPAQEKEIKAAFDKTMVVRRGGPQAKELADLYFFETLVRLHRAGEGAPYTGLKPAGTELGPAVIGADQALESGSVETLVKLVSDQVAAGIRSRFAQAAQRKPHADQSVTAGREFVEAYVEFVHYVERLYLEAAGPAAHQAEQATEHEH